MHGERVDDGRLGSDPMEAVMALTLDQRLLHEAVVDRISKGYARRGLSG